MILAILMPFSISVFGLEFLYVVPQNFESLRPREVHPEYEFTIKGEDYDEGEIMWFFSVPIGAIFTSTLSQTFIGPITSGIRVAITSPGVNPILLIYINKIQLYNTSEVECRLEIFSILKIIIKVNLRRKKLRSIYIYSRML
jgi:hypothetical protein